MTWIPHYAVARCRTRLLESFEGVGMKDALTHLGLQFWTPTRDGGITRAGNTNDTSDAVITGLRNWGRTNGVRVLLCVYNGGSLWDWPLARAGFAEHPKEFADALLSEVNRLQLDGVDLDLEGIGSHETDKDAFVVFVRSLSARLHAAGKHLTVDTFSYHWNAPNQTWWTELLPHVDALTTMGYAEIGSGPMDWRGYASQEAAADPYAARLMIGLPTNRDDWLGNTLTEHLQWLKADGGVGAAYWDAQTTAAAWSKPGPWRILREIRGRQ